MNTVLKIFLSMSFSGSLFILALFLGKRFLKGKISRQWQYYIWLVAILRLLLPFGPETNLMGESYQAIDRAIEKIDSLPEQQAQLQILEDIDAPAAGLEQDNKETDIPEMTGTAKRPLEDIAPLLFNHVWMIWVMAAAGMLIQKVTAYRSFVRCIKAGAVPVSDIDFLDRLSAAGELAGVRKPVELSVNPLVLSPLLVGLFHPCIVLPDTDLSEKDFRYVALHELIHYRRRDILYKWLVQITVCLHWFNPLVHLMAREIARACEFSCDEAVLVKTGYGDAQDYGKTLLDAMAAVGKNREIFGAVTLSGNKRLLKERLGAIMDYRKKSKGVRLLTGVLTLGILTGACYIGVYPVVAASDTFKSADAGNPSSSESAQRPSVTKEVSSEAERYYEADNLPLFEIEFSGLDEEEQGAWLDRIYEDGEIAFFSVCTDQLSTDSSLIEDWAEKLYRDDSIAFFSVLSDQMSEEMLEIWFERALEDKNIAFSSMLSDKLEDDRYDDVLEKEWAEKQLEEYRAAGVTKNGKKYYYQGQLVNIFLDIRSDDKSFHTLDMNPAGTVNIRIIRNEDGQITDVAYMTRAEVTELFGDMDD